jgi:tetratricopeptide (TPR) repeat protein
MNMYDNLERYIDGELQGQELAEMETALAEDPRLKSEYVFRKEVKEAISEDDILNLRDQLQLVTNPQEQPADNAAVLHWMKKHRTAVAAASVALMIGLGGIGYHYMQSPVSTEEIYSEYYEPYEATITFRSADTELNSLLTQAYMKYQEQEYNEALRLFDAVLQKRKDMAANLYSGISYMEIEKYQKARSSFENVIEDKNNLFLDQAKWYMAMCHVKLNNLNEAKDLLRELSEESLYYKKPSKEVMRKLHRTSED